MCQRKKYRVRFFPYADYQQTLYTSGAENFIVQRIKGTTPATNKSYQMKNNQDMYLAAVRAEIEYNGTPLSLAIQRVWLPMRRQLAPARRAPDAVEQISRNGSKARNYRCPVAHLLDLPYDAGNTIYGGHCANYPRTRQSREARQEVWAAVVDWFSANLCRSSLPE